MFLAAFVIAYAMCLAGLASADAPPDRASVEQ
jgi:hypothetical protein